jgi:hypothetical protein
MGAEVARGFSVFIAVYVPAGGRGFVMRDVQRPDATRSEACWMS